MTPRYVVDRVVAEQLGDSVEYRTGMENFEHQRWRICTPNRPRCSWNRKQLCNNSKNICNDSVFLVFRRILKCDLGSTVRRAAATVACTVGYFGRCFEHGEVEAFEVGIPKHVKSVGFDIATDGIGREGSFHGDIVECCRRLSDILLEDDNIEAA